MGKPDLRDPFFGPPFIDIDEWRDAPVRHRYVHGGFSHTDTRFSFYFPPPKQYAGRFLHHIEGASGGHETMSIGAWGSLGSIDFAFSCGAYLVESNQGHFGGDLSILRTEPTVHAFRASAESARYARTLAAEMYGKRPRYGYVFGGSGGSPRTILCLERASDVYDGAVPYIMGHSNSWTLGFSAQANAARTLGEKVYGVVDAMAPGGSGDPFTGLNTEEREALAALYRSGLPRGAELEFLTSGYLFTFSSHISAVLEFDPTYLEDFWSLPGYMGGDGMLATSLVKKKTTVARVVCKEELQERFGPRADHGRMLYTLALASAGAPLGIVARGIDPKKALGASIKMMTGAAAGHELQCIAVLDDVLIGSADTPYRFEGVEPGDEILVDNRKYLAFCYYHRHQVDDSDQYAPYRVDGRAVYPQRPLLGGAELSGASLSGEFKGKMIVVQNAHDAATMPNAAHSWRKQVTARLGDRIDHQFRLWYMDHAQHIPASMLPQTEPPTAAARLIDYEGCLQQALRDLIGWVEDGREPPPTTGYQIDHDQKLTLAPTTAERGGIQPVVVATANGSIRANVRVGELVTFEANAEVPPGAGTIIGVEWDFEGRAEWELRDETIDGTASQVHVKASHVFTTPGTYFPAVRVTSHRDGDVAARHARVKNLDRVRVVVN